MKKTFLCSMVALATLGCSKEGPDTIVLNPSEISSKKGETHQINVTSESDLTYSTENNFHAEVDENGLVTANYVGETMILVANAEDNKPLKVIVEPRSQLYPDPVLEYKKTKNEIRTQYGTPLAETNQVIAYDNYSANAPGLLFVFDTNGICTGITILVKNAFLNQLADFVQERYHRISREELYFSDTYNPDNAKSIVHISVYNPLYHSVLYMDASQL